MLPTFGTLLTIYVGKWAGMGTLPTIQQGIQVLLWL